ncbi:putative carboxypeptidase C [Helianthus annuus]|uniref:Carboxypeptidase C n=1 Tax=Helianthus annuus TaxID=4232 RepID=A0A9K3J601_HELAN|nr:putative carboxypeptidase C [Helianthus annuus]KAJ0756618.1 putative carboxypeptidase C [Helianthus annuus]KAJ0760365.1 putative carboxypeptidase C [Helianthus annuus]KAJ0930160.1 putative carboxypeptidase C [Helianthus annuus]
MAKSIFIFPLILFLLAPIGLTETVGFENPSFPSTFAEKMIREFNLFPERSVNVVEDESDVVSEKKLVEKRFVFPNFVDSSGASVEELGHHAGYYKIEHSYAARVFDFGLRVYLLVIGI